MARHISSFSEKKVICSWDLDPKRSDGTKLNLERFLKLLPAMQWKKVKGVEDSDFLPCDLAVIYAWHLNQIELQTWLENFEKRWKKSGAIWIPALIVSPLDIGDLLNSMDGIWASNWYFDIIHPDHFLSLPVRVANLLRIHDHLHELVRYEAEMKAMQDNIRKIEHEIAAMKKD
ncbi:MAG: hypothetical protein EOP07_01180 [Proteobacteria bacterium]|nr:MAG: hypothetical protein EOP07_01180 [Pseudomonadota bacterium]